MEYYEDNEGISLGQVFKVIFRRWKLLLIITATIFVLGVVFSQLIYNRNKVYYNTTIEYVNVTGSEDGTYINKSIFNYRDIIKLETLNDVKDKNEDFSSIDVKSIVDKEDISITKNVKEETKLVTYTLSIKGKYFKDSTQAKDFLYAVLNSAIDELVSNVENANNKSYLLAYKEAKDYEAQIDALNNEIDLIDKKYTDLLNIYAESSVDDKPVSEYQILLQNDYGKSNGQYKVIEDLKNELNAKNYVKDFKDNEDSLKNKKAALEKKININLAIIKSLEDKIALYNSGKKSDEYTETDLIISGNANDAFTPLTTEISRLQAENSKMQNDINVINNQLLNQGGSEEDIKAFEAKLTALYNKLVKTADEYTEVSTSVVKSYSRVEYTDKAIESKGGLGLVISALLFLALGLVVAAIVNLIVDRKYLKETNAVSVKPQTNNKKEEENKEE